MRLCSKHAQPGKALLDSFNLLSGARTCLRGAARRNLSMVSESALPPCAFGDETLTQTHFQQVKKCCCLLNSIELHHS